MSPARRRRLWRTFAVAGLMAAAASMVLVALDDNLTFFYTPSQVAQKGLKAGADFRLGGLVEAGSLAREPGTLKVRFAVADQGQRIPVMYEGVLPDLFGENKGMVATGRLDARGVFHAREVLAKHDENYRPPGAGASAARRPAWVVAQ